MQERIEVPQPLQGQVYIDHESKVIYLNSRSLLKDSAVITIYMQLKPRGYVLDVNPDVVASNSNNNHKGEQIRSEGVLVEIENIIRGAVGKKVSDIHIEVKDGKTAIFFREDGLLKKVYDYSEEEGNQMCQALYANASALSHTSFAETEYQYGNIRQGNLALPELEGIRLQRGMMLGGQFTVLRLLYKNASSGVNIVKGENFKDTVFKTFENYGYTTYTAEMLEPVLRGAEGLILISGPTGAGKSTALKLMLELMHLLYPTKSIFTIENPPEYKIQGAKQLPVPENGSFAEVLKVALRSDPDIIMVGETRDEETAKTMINAVLTGHMVVSTVHARDVYTIFERLKRLNIDVDELIKANLIKVAISQRLVPALCDHCKKKVIFPDGIEAYLSEGCPKCNDTGVKGRAVVEETIDHTFLNKYGLEQIRAELKIKKRDLVSNAIRLVKAGKISPQTAMGFVGYFSHMEYNLS
ncbi:MAG: ATPase, T2SS/T4P/T4SS family [Thermoproteota archaeon]